MILFGRLGNAVRSVEPRDWVLLTLETIAVVAGILIAFELSEFAERRREAVRHDRLMERLFDESEVTVSSIRGTRDIIRSFVDAEMKFAVELSQGGCPASTDWDEVGTVGLLPAVGAQTSVYEELTGAGGVASVKLQTVRHALAEFHANLDWVERQVAFFRDSRITVLEPSDERVRVRFDPKADEPEIWEFDRAALCKDQGFRNRFASATRHHFVYLSYIDELAEKAIIMCASLGASMGRSCQPKPGGPFVPNARPLVASEASIAKQAAEKVRAELNRT